MIVENSRPANISPQSLISSRITFAWKDFVKIYDLAVLQYYTFAIKSRLRNTIFYSILVII